MAIDKLIHSSALPDHFYSSVSLIEDPKLFVKKASESGFLFDYEKLKPDKNHTGIHLVALGDMETYGANRNGDCFPKFACAKYHDTFVKHGAVYRHHKHDDRSKAIGEIKASAYNEPMGRVELFIHAHNEKAAPELEKLATEKDIPFSMSCVANPEYPVLTIDGYKPIKNIVVGDIVFTHAGNWKKVTQLIRRNYSGVLRTFKVFGLAMPLELTADHPMLAKHFSGEDKSGVFCSQEDYDKVPFEWMESGVLDVGDRFKYRTIASIPGYASIDDIDLAAECGSCVKYIGPELFNSSDEVKLAFLGAWADGDGFIDDKGLHWFGLSANLALQGRDLLASLGILSCIYRIEHQERDISGDGTVSNAGTEYALNVSGHDMSALLDHCAKVKDCEGLIMTDSGKPAAMCLDSDTEYSYLIEEITERSVTDFPVYNFEVEEDESYSLAGLVSHNCRVPGDICTICNNFRKSSKDPNQCEHILYKVGQVFEDGRVVGMINADPTFFDISFVTKPADRIAWTLKSAAFGDLGKIPSAELAEIEEMSVPHSVRLGSSTALRKYEIGCKIAQYENIYRKMAEVGPSTEEEHVLWELRKSAASVALDDGTIEILRSYEPQDVFYALARHSIVMDPVTYVKYAMGSDMGALKDSIEDIKLACAGACSEMLKSGELYDACNDSTYDVQDFIKYGSAQRSYLEKVASQSRTSGSIDEAEASGRAIANALCGVPVETLLCKKSEKNNCSPLAKCVARKYIAYKLASAGAMQAMGRLTERHYALMAARNITNVK